MNDDKTEWISVYENGEYVPYIAEYECLKCGYFSYKKYSKCQSCKRRYVDPHDEMYE